MTLDELLRQKADLDRQITEYQNEGRNKAIADIRVLMAQHGLTAQDVAPSTKKASGPGNGAESQLPPNTVMIKVIAEQAEV